MKFEYLQNRDFTEEFIINASRSSGAGGQNVNKVNTKVELRFNISDSKLLTDAEKETIANKLKNRINNDGFFILSCQEERSQLKNKEIVINRFYELLNKALIPRKKRKPTKISKAVKEKRFQNKKNQSEKKNLRKKMID
ncbi:MAG TPA: aminoacyl-tRNA hydrolase [Bacteroidales bacterium]|nr:MAG: peptide chain release factor 1 [Bacteroidetes bacterium GWF2_33_38]OFY91585.1 MAG: peptide chain release factor 1 [Bacteroidetes bacterium RIFOXYA2_FULL_33_7]HBF88572.1 aminoacyl-tRNA hydrolase [Bacteroidales bacterium]